MELWGIGADMDACLRARHIIIKKLKELEKEAYRLAGRSFSLNATADIADILYTHLKLPVPKGCEKGKLHPSTDKQSLDHLRYLQFFPVDSCDVNFFFLLLWKLELLVYYLLFHDRPLFAQKTYLFAYIFLL